MTAADRRSRSGRSGGPAETPRLVVHADDLGLARSVNAASTRALEAGRVDSASVMVPCPAFPEIAAWARSRPALDLGIHLTLTSELKGCRWGPVLPRERVPTLVDRRGFFPATCEALAKRADPAEAERELRAQVERALDLRVRPTHLDTHSGSVFYSAELFDAYLRVGREFGLPVFAPEAILKLAPALRERLAPGELPFDHVVMAGREQQPEGLADLYREALEKLAPGVTQLIVHLALDDDEMRAVSAGQRAYGARWRQSDFDFVMGDEFPRLLERRDIRRTTWREIGRALRSG